jgi:hypothetical protein
MAKQTPYRLTKIDEIKPYDRNPRIIPQAAVDAVAKSIQAFGFRQPIVVDGNGVILAGHTRYRAALQLGLSEVPVVWQTDISAIQAQGYRIADNKTAELSAWDRDALDTEVRGIAAQCDADLDALGLADWELERILQETQESGLPEETPPPSYSQAYTPYSNGERSGDIEQPGRRSPNYQTDSPDTDPRRAVKITFPSREALEAAKGLLDRAANENLGVITVCDP